MTPEPEHVLYVRNLVKRLDFSCEIFSHKKTGKTTQDAEAALGLESKFIIKAMLLKSKKSEYLAAIIRGSDRLNVSLLESLTGYKRIHLARVQDTHTALGFEAGGIPPVIFYVKGIKTFVDINVLQNAYAIGSGGTPFYGMKFQPHLLVDKLHYIPTTITQENNNEKFR